MKRSKGRRRRQRSSRIDSIEVSTRLGRSIVPDNPYLGPTSSTQESTSRDSRGLHALASKKPRSAFGVAVTPPLLMLVLFYTLAIHMRQSLGAWPTSSGEKGFPIALLIHTNLALGYFSILAASLFFFWPVAFLVCLGIRRCRFMLYYLTVYALSCLICYGAMSLAPAPFLYWWWD